MAPDRYNRRPAAGRPLGAPAGRPSRASGSGRSVRMPQTNPRRARAASAPTRGAGYRSAPARSRQPYGRGAQPPLRSVRVGDVGGFQGGGLRDSYRNYMGRFVKVGIALAIVAAIFFALYHSGLFAIKNVTVTGVSHITSEELAQLAAVPVDSTLLRVDAAGIESRLKTNAWVDRVAVNRIPPDTLELAITERNIAAVVEVSANSGETTQRWAIASDGTWLMDIPDQNSEAAKSVSGAVYTDADAALKITNVPYGVAPQVGSACTDDSVLNALAIVDGMTTSLKDQVKSVSASGTDNTVLTLSDGVQIAFGDSNDIRDKERVCLQLIEDHPGEIAYINVRNVNAPTWRSL